MDDIDGIIFDFGGTLDTHGEHWYHFMSRAYQDVGKELSREAYIYGERNITPLVAPDDTMLDLLRKKVALQTAALGVDGAGIAELCYARSRECVARSAEELRRLRGRYRMAVVSNFYGNLDAVLSDYGIRELFDVVVDSAVAGVRKPDPTIFRLALKRLAIPPERILVVGDSEDKDIRPAAGLGCRTFLVDGKRW